MASYPEPDTMDAQGWGALTASVISAARYHSAELDTADSERLYETVFDGLLSQPDGFSRYAGRDAARENRPSRDGFRAIGRTPPPHEAGAPGWRCRECRTGR